MHAAFVIIILTLIPTLELRASIPYGILATHTPLWLVVLLAIITNILLGFLVYELVDVGIFLCRKMKWFDTLFQKIIVHAQKRIQKKVDQYGELGVALFIGIPLPGSGVYTGALGAYLLGVSRKDFYLATIIGVLIAAVLVTLITLFASGLFSWAIKVV